MTRYAVDASVGIKWFLPEIHSELTGRPISDTRKLSHTEYSSLIKRREHENLNA